jgi:hypothetical protein
MLLVAMASVFTLFYSSDPGICLAAAWIGASAALKGLILGLPEEPRSPTEER